MVKLETRTIPSFSFQVNPQEHVYQAAYEKKNRKKSELDQRNLKMLNRLQEVKSNYDQVKWMDQRKTEEHKLSQLCEYPHIFRDRKSSGSPSRTQLNESRNGNWEVSKEYRSRYKKHHGT
jgi:hypothetical protein